MVGLGCAVGVGGRVELQPNSWHYHHHYHHHLAASSKAITVTRSGFPSSSSSSNKNYANFTTTNGRFRRVTPHNSKNREGVSSSSSEWIRNSGIISSCLVGLLTGVAVVLFNNVVHEIRDLLWDGIPDKGASWLREAPIQETWKRVILVPAFGGLLVSLLNLLSNSNFNFNSRPFLKAIAASVTLGTGNSLGPEGPSVDIGNSIAKWIASTPLFTSAKLLPLRAAGSAAGLSAGFNAAVAGCFFAVESVLWPSDSDSSNLSLTNTTSTVILSAVIASVISEIGLGSQPAFQVPDYDFRSPAELPLYLLLGILCGLVSLTLSWSTSYMLTLFDNLHKATGMPKASFPILGGLSVGLIALLYPEILYWGFENVDILLESRPFVKGLSTDLLLQLIAVKIVTTSLCRASGLVGGYYAPSLFIGGATGMAYGKLIAFAVAHSNPVINLSVLEVASPQAYGLEILVSELCVLNGGICSVPRTVTPDMELCHAQMIMKEHRVNQVPVVKNIYERTYPIGLLDPDSVSLTYSALAARQSLSRCSKLGGGQEGSSV